MYESETILWREKNNLRDLLGVGRINRIPNARVRELNSVEKGVGERTGVRIENSNIGKTVNKMELMGSFSVGRRHRNRLIQVN